MEKGEWLKVDLQTHTTFGEGGRSVEEVVSKAAKFECDAIAITDNAEHRLNTFNNDHWEEIRRARERHPGVVIIGGMEWNVPPFGRDAQAVVLLPTEGNELVTLSEFRAQFDDAGLAVHDPERARNALAWLAQRADDLSVPPVIFYVDPSRSGASADDVVSRMRNWRSVNTLVAGVTGAPGRQAATVIGGYTGSISTIDRWDPAVALSGGAWDQLLQKKADVWCASATANFHRDTGLPGGEDFWPGEFAETWVYAPERTAAGILKALKAGAFFGAHGHIARQVEFTVSLPDLPRRAYAGERIEVTPGSQVMLSVSGEIPEKDWEGNPNRIDTVELIITSDEGTRDVVKTVSANAAFIALESITVPLDGCVVRARGRRINNDGDDLTFFTNPIRISVRHSHSLTEEEELAPSVESSPSGWLALMCIAGLIGASAGSLWTVKSLIGESSSASAGYRIVSGGPSRRWYSRLGLVWLAIMCYSALVPFRFQMRPWRDVAADLASITWLLPAAADRTLLWVHLWLAFVLGFLWLGALVADHRRMRVKVFATVVVLVLGMTAVGAWEFATAMLLGQKLSEFKLIAGGAGVLLGVVGWLTWGESLHRRLRDYFGVINRRSQTDWLLIAYVFGLAVCSIMPFDLMLLPEDLHLKVEAKRIALVPFSHDALSFQSIFISILSFIPVGMCMTRVGTGNGRHLRPFLPSLAFVALFAAGVEFGRFLAFSRTIDSTYLLTHLVGGLIGVAIARFPGSEEHRLIVYYADKYRLGRYLHWKIAAVFYSLLLCLLMWWPFEVLGNSTVVAQRFSRFVRWPFSVWQHPAEPNPITKMMFFVPLGIMLAQIIGDPSLPASLRKRLSRIALVLVCLFGLGLELLQGFLPPNVPDITDAMLYAAGAALGMAVTSKWLRSSE